MDWVIWVNYDRAGRHLSGGLSASLHTFDVKYTQLTH